MRFAHFVYYIVLCIPGPDMGTIASSVSLRLYPLTKSTCETTANDVCGVHLMSSSFLYPTEQAHTLLPFSLGIQNC